MIPKIIWQTYKTARPPERAIKNIKSWTTHNPHHKYRYSNDQQCENFIRDYFDTNFFSMYKSLPIGVMKADVWRAAVVYQFGGIYADLDTECRGPASKWIDKNDSLVVTVENKTGAIGNYVFAAIPKHPAIYSVLENFVEIYQSDSFLNKRSQTPVQDFGAHGWSIGILKYYGLNEPEIMQSGGEEYNKCLRVIADRTKFYPSESKILSAYPNENTLVYHQTASVFWLEGYESWRKEQERQLGVFGV